jgi:hypothetical protein
LELPPGGVESYLMLPGYPVGAHAPAGICAPRIPLRRLTGRTRQVKVLGFLHRPLTSTVHPSRSSLPGCPSAQKTGVLSSFSLLIGNPPYFDVLNPGFTGRTSTRSPKAREKRYASSRAIDPFPLIPINLWQYLLSEIIHQKKKDLYFPFWKDKHFFRTLHPPLSTAEPCQS